MKKFFKKILLNILIFFFFQNNFQLNQMDSVFLLSLNFTFDISWSLYLVFYSKNIAEIQFYIFKSIKSFWIIILNLETKNKLNPLKCTSAAFTPCLIVWGNYIHNHQSYLMLKTFVNNLLRKTILD